MNADLLFEFATPFSFCFWSIMLLVLDVMKAVALKIVF